MLTFIDQWWISFVAQFKQIWLLIKKTAAEGENPENTFNLILVNF